MKLTRDTASEIAGHVVAKLSAKHPEASWGPDDLEPVIDGILTAHGESLGSQVERLASFILREIPGEPSQDEGAIDTSIRTMRRMKAELKEANFQWSELKKAHDKAKEGKAGDPFDDNMTPEERAKEEASLKYDEMERRHEQSVEDALERGEYNITVEEGKEEK